MNDWYYGDDLNHRDDGWHDMLTDIEEEMSDKNPPNRIVNDMHYKDFRKMDDDAKMEYLYNKLRNIYSYLSSIQDVV